LLILLVWFAVTTSGTCCASAILVLLLFLLVGVFQHATSDGTSDTTDKAMAYLMPAESSCSTTG
jgi:uncharacterized membrane protein